MKGRPSMKLHHNAYRCRDSEQTCVFYENFLGRTKIGPFATPTAT